jgi:hypothetical protein
MKRFAFAFATLALLAGPVFAQSNVRIVGRSSDGIDRPVLTTTDGRLQVDSNGGAGGTTPTGTAGTPNSSVVSVQGVSGGTAVPVSNTSLTTIATNTTGISTSALQTSMNTKLDTIHTDMIAPTPAGTNVIGSVSINQATPGSTNLVDTVTKSVATDRGAVVTTAATAQQLMASNTARRGFAIQNQSAGACYISGTATATQDFHSLRIDAGAFYETPPTHTGTGAVSIICAVASASVYAREW